MRNAFRLGVVGGRQKCVGGSGVGAGELGVGAGVCSKKIRTYLFIVLLRAHQFLSLCAENFSKDYVYLLTQRLEFEKKGKIKRLLKYFQET